MATASDIELDEIIATEGASVQRTDGALLLTVVDRHGNVVRKKLLMKDAELFIEDGIMYFTDSHEAKTTLRYANQQ